MARIEPGVAYLTGYVLEPEGLHPREVQLTSVAHPSPGRAFPSQYLTQYYGAQTTLREIPRRRTEAILNKQELYEITTAVRVQNIIVEPLTFEKLNLTRMMNMECLSNAVKDRIEEYWSSYLREEGRADEWTKENADCGSIDFISDRLDLLPRLATESEFSHLALIVYPVAVGSTVVRVGTVLDHTAIRRHECKEHRNLEVGIPLLH
jgi:hypothetical protein